MEIRFESGRKETAGMDTAGLCENFLLDRLVQSDALHLAYTHYDRMIAGGAAPVTKKLELPCPDELRANFFLERRELGIINVGGKGTVEADGKTWELENLDCLYVGRGTRSVSFAASSSAQPPVFFLLSATADADLPTVVCRKESASPVNLGTQDTGNVRTIYKYIHAAGTASCRLVMGLTRLEPGSVWNSIPPHTHTRRTEIYFYFDLAENERIFHFMGEPQETRHVVVQNHQAVISPPWSVHFGCGTRNYGFIWGMAGENLAFDDMDAAPVNTLL